MLSTKHIIRAQLTDDATPADAFAGLETMLVDAVENDTLNTLVISAVRYRSQGRIDQSIQLITQANRAQLDAIEALQGILDTLNGRPKQQVVFSRYRQFIPFEMGVEEADDALGLIGSLRDERAPGTRAQCKRLHELEAARNDEVDRLEFFEQRFVDGSQSETIEEARTNLGALNIDLLHAKHEVLNDTLTAVQSFLIETGGQVNNLAVCYELSRWLYVLATSPTRTRHADDVQTEMNT